METTKQIIAAARKSEGVLGKCEFTEPVFCLVARDVTAPDTVRDWARRAAKAGSPAVKIGNAMLDAEAMERWQARHGSKVPD